MSGVAPEGLQGAVAPRRGALAPIGEKANTVTNRYQMQAYVSEESSPLVGELSPHVGEALAIPLVHLFH